MNRLRKIGTWAVLLLAALIVTQIGVSFALRTRRMHGYLIAHLERAFGRPVQVSGFAAQIFPLPQLEMNGITVGEDPRFGNEYFLRAESMSASLRWTGLLGGHFEFGTMSLTRPSLILVRNESGTWNLESWLPPAEAKNGASISYGPQVAPSPSNYLERIEFDGGRINFKTGDQKRAFAFTDVSGSVEQKGPGRWQLKLEAKPWRSGVVLQSAGTLYVQGDVAGTSARLQPAQVHVHWGKVSLADLFRLVTGNDSGMRGELGVDGTASVGAPINSPADTMASLGTAWKYEVEAWAARVHRSDLTERSDNPRVSVHAKGKWDLRANEAVADEIKVDLARSNLRGKGTFVTNAQFPWNAEIDSAAVDGQDLMAWYRAFKPDVAEGIVVQQLFTGRGKVRGWPLQWDDAHLASVGGSLRAVGITEALRIGAVRGELQRSAFVVQPVRIFAEAASVASVGKNEQAAGRPRERQDWAVLRFVHDSDSRNGALRAEGHLDQAELFFKVAAAFGKTVNHGWELSGPVSSGIEWQWQHGLFKNGRWNGTVHFAKTELQAAGLNQPIELNDAQLEWKAGQRTATIADAQAFGTEWTGTIAETRAENDGDLPRWQFRLHADHLDAAELDRWAGPRARPTWLQRLLPSLLGNANAGGKPSELLRRLWAEGDLSADTISVEKVTLNRAHAKLSLQNLRLNVRDAQAEWEGGSVRGTMQAVFSASPEYEIAAEFEHARLGQLPWIPGWAERWNGIASGRIHLGTVGVGRDELLSKITGGGEIQLKDVEFRGWDVASCLESGEERKGDSHWTSGEGEFQVKDRVARFEGIRLDGPRTKTLLSGSMGFGQGVALRFSAGSAEDHGAAPARMMRVSGGAEEPVIVIENVSGTTRKP